MKWLLLLILFFPGFVSAQIEISEIMYDLEGSDSKREWVEIQNTAGSGIDLTGWKLFESGSNHALTLIEGSEVVPASGFAIIADNAATFLSDNPSFVGTVFDSSFSLSNTGETLTIRDDNLSDIDTVTYTSDLGAGGDGNSLQKLAGSFVPGLPTPGETNTTELAPENNNDGAEDNDQTSSVFEQPDPKRINVEIVGNKIVLAGADTLFNAEGFGTSGEPLENARYIWNFGDGTIREGSLVFKSFAFPGEYVVFVQAISGKYVSTNSIRVTAKPSELSVSSAESGPFGFVELKNDSNDRLDISFWHLRIGETRFTFAPRTNILPKMKISFPNSVTKLPVVAIESVELLYPNGIRAFIEERKTEKTFVPKVKNVPISKEIEPVTIYPEPDIVTSKKDFVENPTSSASVVLGVGDNPDRGVYWLLALVGVLGTAIVGFLLVRSSKDEHKGAVGETQRVADEISLID